MDDKLVAGTKSGSFIVWGEDMKILKEIQEAHSDSILSLCACPEGFVSGCAKGMVILWSTNLQKVASFDIGSSPSPLPPLQSAAISSIDICPHLSRRSLTMRILVRTQSGDILEISCVTGNIFHYLVKSVLLDEAPSVAPNPGMNEDCADGEEVPGHGE